MRSLHEAQDQMECGRQLWLEMVESHAHVGGRAELLLKWGRNLQAEELRLKGDMTALVVTPAGEKEVLPLEHGFADYRVIHVDVPASGFYHALVKWTRSCEPDRGGQRQEGSPGKGPDDVEAVQCVQYAQFFIPVGHDLVGVPQRAGIEAEIVPEAWKRWRVGDEIPLKLLLHGRPAPKAVLDMSYSGPSVQKQWKETADEDGRLRPQASWPGRYLAAASLAPERQAGGGSALFLTAALSFIVVK